MTKEYKKDKYLGRIHGRTGVTIVDKDTISIQNIKATKGHSVLMTPAIDDYTDNECVGEIISFGSTSINGVKYFNSSSDGNPEEANSEFSKKLSVLL